jgi:Ca2+-binding RTX toxin-like protein
LNFSAAVAGVTMTATAGTNILLGSSSVANTITGGSGSDAITGGTGIDTINGNGGNDFIYADNAGADRVETHTLATNPSTGEVATITIAGIASSFTIGVTQTVTAAATGLAAAINANANLSGIVTAAAGGAVVTVTYLVDGVASAGTYAVSAGGMADTVAQGTAGTAGTAAADIINGGAGNDVIVGGGGADTITGGTGADNYFFMKAQSTVGNAATRTWSIITDYSLGANNVDKIILGNQVAVSGVATVQDYSSQSSLLNAFNTAATANTTNNGTVVFIFGGNEYVYVETTGATNVIASSDFAVQLTGIPVAAGGAITGNFILGV